MRIAFDVDDTLWKLVEDTDRRIPGVGARCSCGMALKQEPDQELTAMAHDLITSGNQVFLWSAGGMDHAKAFMERYAPAWPSLGVQVIPKEKGQNIDICFDDQDVNLATVNVRVKRQHADHWGDNEGPDSDKMSV